MSVKAVNKESQMLSLNSDARRMLKEQADRAGVAMSTYVERLILEKDWEFRQKVEPKPEHNGDFVTSDSSEIGS